MKANRYVQVDPNTGVATVNTMQALMLYHALKMQVNTGMHLTAPSRMGGTAFAVVKREFNLKGNKQAVLDQFKALLESMGLDPK
jgi:hypothetical protein